MIGNTVLVPGWKHEELPLGSPPWAGFCRAHGQPANSDWTPATSLYDTGERLIAEAELPGVNRAGIAVTVRERVLTIRAESKKRMVEGADFIFCERPRGTFSRSFELEADVDASKVEATYVDGILEILLPKAESAKPHKISVTVK